MIAPEQDSRKDNSRQNSTRRQRAPTITIDTSAVSPPARESNGTSVQTPSHHLQAPHKDNDSQRDDEHDPLSGPGHRDQQPAELRPANSFDSRDSRPTSPHNISSPTSKWGSQHQTFLSVPSARSRGNSVDSEDIANSPTSYGGDTFIPSPASSQNGDTRRLETAHSDEPLLRDDEALKADPGNEKDFVVKDNKFAFTPGQLNKLLNPTSLGAYHALGGIRGLEKGLRTDRRAGLSVDEKQLEGTVTFKEATGAAATNPQSQNEVLAPVQTPGSDDKVSKDSFHDRKRVFSDNRLPDKKAKTIFELAWLAYNDKVLILLTVAAVVSLALGIYQSIKPPPGEVGAHVEWVEGVAIMVAIVIVVVVGAANDWQKERQFVKLNKKKDDRIVNIIRSGKSREISVHDILVGDVMHLEPGDMIPADGIFISGHNVICDESSATGESDLKRKTGAAEAFNAIEAHESLKKVDPFIISGAKVNEGVGTFLVTSTGVNSSHGKTMMSLREDAQTTPLQGKLNKLAEYIAKLGLAAGLLLFVVTFIEFLARLNHPPGGTTDWGPSDKGQAFLNVFIVAVTVVVVAVPEGLPLAVTLALAFATTRMLKDNNLVRMLRACETMGNATTICSDKTGTLTQNKMTVVAGTIGAHCRFGGKSSSEEGSKSPLTPKEVGLPTQSTDTKPARLVADSMAALSADVRTLLKQSMVFNTTAFEGESGGSDPYIGSKTETALLLFARDHLAMGALGEERSSAQVVQLVPFDSGRKCMATAVKLPEGGYRLFVKGASEIMLTKCTSMIRDPTTGLTETPLTQEIMNSLSATIGDYATRSLRTIGLLYKDFEQWPPKGLPTDADDPKLIDFDKSFKDMVFLGIVGIQDPLRDGVTDAVRACQKAGVYVRMVTGDNIMTAKAIASECGIFTPGGIVMEGPQFRKMSRVQMSQTIPRLQVLARSSPEDKRVLVKRLREMGETVAVTGDGTNDAPALKTADVGFSMGISGTEVAKEASAIILMDDNFASIVKAMMWGRAVNDAVKKFLQFQVTVNITAVVITFISAVVSTSETSVLNAVQLLWVNLIMDTFAALALATDPPTPGILDRKPEPKSAPLITLTMWKMIIGQAIFQVIATLILYYAGPQFLGYGPTQSIEMKTLVFNAFVWMQIFNQYNCRRLDNKFNIFEGIFANYFFIGIQFIICAGQVLIVFKGGAAFGVKPLNGPQWGISIILGLLSVPIAIFIRMIPDDFIRRCIPAYFERKSAPEVLVSDDERQFQWNPALEEIKQDLAFLKLVRGGRLNVLRYKLQHPRELLLPRSRSVSRSRSRASSMQAQTPDNEQIIELGNNTPPPRTPESRRSTSRRPGRSRSNSAFGPAAAMAGIVAGSIAGWSPVDRRDGDGFARLQLQDRSDLEGHPGVEVHSGTRADDPVLSCADDVGGKPPSQNPETAPSYGQSLAPPSRDGEMPSSKGVAD